MRVDSVIIGSLTAPLFLTLSTPTCNRPNPFQMARFARTILALTAIASVALTIGAHILALQGVAYVRMFSEYQKTMSAEEAFELTFSGKEICGICVAVDQIQADMDQTLQDFSQQNSPVILLFATSTQPLSIRQTGKHLKWAAMPDNHPNETVHPTASPPPRIVVA